MHQSALNSPFHHAVDAIRHRNWPQVRRMIHDLVADPQGAIAPAQRSELESLLQQVWAVLDDGDFHDRWDVAKLLVESGDWAIAPLIDRLQDEDTDPDLRWFAARTLGNLQSPQALAPLLTVLTTAENDDLRAMAATALAQLGEMAIAPLLELMQEAATRSLAVEALAQIHHPQTLPALMEAASDPDATLRARVMEALGHYGDADGLSILRQALRDHSAAVRKAAVVGVARRADETTAADLVPSLAPLLSDLNPEVGRQAAIALGRCGTTEAVALLVQTLRSPHTPLPLQVELVRTLAWLGTPAALHALQAMLLHPPAHHLDGQVYQTLIAELARTDDPTAHPEIAQVLTQLLQSDHPARQHLPARRAMIVGLGQVGQIHHLDVLIPSLADPDRGLQLHTVFALKQLGGEVARQRLHAYLDSPDLTPALRHGITVALREWVHP